MLWFGVSNNCFPIFPFLLLFVLLVLFGLFARTFRDVGVGRGNLLTGAAEGFR